MIASIWLSAALVFPAGSARALSPENSLAKPVVAVALPGRQDFWRRCQQAMQDYARLNDLELRLVFSQNDQMTQNTQVRQLLAASPDVLILAAHDALGAASAVKLARNAKVKVMALDRLTLNADLDLYLAFDHEEAGTRQAQYLVDLAPAGPYVILSGPPNDYSAHLSLKGALKVLDPLIESGRIQVLADGPILDGQAEKAGDLIHRLLDQGRPPVAILAPNDLTAGEVVAALRAAGLSGQMPVAGQNGSPAAARLIRNREQALTLVKDPAVLAERALELAVTLALGKDLATEAKATINNGLKDVPAVLLPTPPVDRHNLETALTEGIIHL